MKYWLYFMKKNEDITSDIDVHSIIILTFLRIISFVADDQEQLVEQKIDRDCNWTNVFETVVSTMYIRDAFKSVEKKKKIK